MRAGALFCCLLLLTGCSAGSAGPSEELPVVVACFITGTDSRIPVSLEVAATPQQRRKGLMGREHLAPDAGMLFRYRHTQSPANGFWMYQTLIPLDIAFMDENGAISSIQHMTPCSSSAANGCPSYPAGVEYDSAVEMNAGFFKAKGIAVGDRLELRESACSRR